MSAIHSAGTDPVIRFRALGDGVHELATWTRLKGPPADVFPFFADAGNLARITPPELGFRIVTPLPLHMGEGTEIEYRLRLFGVPFGWRTRIAEWDPPHGFADVQLEGPYALWHHTHIFEGVRSGPGPDGGADHGGTLMTDRVRFRLPLGRLGAPALPLVKLQLRRIFGYRGEAIRRLLPG